jgi:AraC family transcriptional regulator
MNTKPNNLSSKVLKSAEAAGFVLTDNIYPAGYGTPLHAHDDAYFCFVVEGNYTLEYNGRGHFCGVSRIIFFPPGAEHACRMHTHSRCMNVQLHARFLDSLNSRIFDIPPDHISQKRLELEPLAKRLYREFYSMDEFSPLTVEGLVAELAAEFFRFSKGSKGHSTARWLVRARDFLQHHYTSEVSLSSLAKVASVHPTHLAREFQKNFHITIGDFVRRRRVELACKRLITSRVPLSEIAVESGFFDQSHFTRVFKKATGMTPGAYRVVFHGR